MQLYGFSKKIINTTRIENVVISMTSGEITFDVVSDYKDPGVKYDIPKGREEGTKRHKTAPTKKKAISWVVKGIRFFSKGHWVKGIVERRIIKNTIREKLPLVQQKVDAATNKFFSQIMGPEKRGGV